MSESTWNEDTLQADKAGTTPPPPDSAGSGGVGDSSGGQAGTRTGDPRSGGTSGTTTGDAPYDLDSEHGSDDDAQSPSGT